MAPRPAPTPDALTARAVERAKAEAAEWADMLAFEDAERERTEQLPFLRRQVERSAVAMEIGQAMCLSEGQVQHRLAAGRRVRETAPIAWLAFQDGRIDSSRIREISTTIDQLQRPESIARLDAHVVKYAATHTVAELRRWLKDFVNRVETDLALERAERDRAERHVSVTHVENSMSWINAFVPTHQAAAIEKRLNREAKALGAGDPDEKRTVAQRETDLFVSWLTSNENRISSITSDIAVTIEADVMTGLVDGFAKSADGSWAVPAKWALETALEGDAFWHRMLIAPITHDVLAFDYVGRFAPELLVKAIAFRDGVCRAPGCLKPADECDDDHRIPHPEGPTNGRNIWPLCRKHHNLKGHQVIRWTLPSGQVATAERAAHAPPCEETSPAEQALATLLIEYVPQ